MEPLGTLVIGIHVSYAVSPDNAKGKFVILRKWHYCTEDSAREKVAEFRANNKNFGYAKQMIAEFLQAYWQAERVEIR